MKKYLLIVVLIPTLGLAENLFRNSDMETGAAWSGDRRIETVDENKVMVMEAKKSRTVSCHQDAATRGQKDLILKFRYRTKDYHGRGLQLRGARQNDSSTFRTINLKADDQWHDFEWPFSEIRGSSKIRFSFELLEGEGKVFLDDIVLEPKP
ncbi:MAG: hypothetical protein H0V54_14410 [Chthoniobacterales bacterium]|nr:hypothetical protein [Chthoniobacterales bacterium]